jgi:hypothetical protein
MRDASPPQSNTKFGREIAAGDAEVGIDALVRNIVRRW